MAEVSGISQKIGQGSSHFNLSYNDESGWKHESKDEKPTEPTYHYALRFSDEDGKERVEEVDSESATPLGLETGSKLTIHYSTLLRGVIWSDEAFTPPESGAKSKGFEEGFAEVRMALLVAIAVGLFMYAFGRVGIFITDRILLSVRDGAVTAIRERQDKENPDA